MRGLSGWDKPVHNTAWQEANQIASDRCRGRCFFSCKDSLAVEQAMRCWVPPSLQSFKGWLDHTLVQWLKMDCLEPKTSWDPLWPLLPNLMTFWNRIDSYHKKEEHLSWWLASYTIICDSGSICSSPPSRNNWKFSNSIWYARPKD